MSRRQTMESKEAAESKEELSDSEARGSKPVMCEVDDEELADEAKPPRRASVGWGTETTGEKDTDPPIENPSTESKRPGRRRKGGDSSSTASANSRLPKNRHFDDDDETTDIVEIPDLEEDEREPDITAQVADAPKNTMRSVQTLKELDRDMKFSLPSTATLGIDLSLLTTCLCPEKALCETDESWNFDGLLNEVSQEMQKDLDEKEELLKAEEA